MTDADSDSRTRFLAVDKALAKARANADNLQREREAGEMAAQERAWDELERKREEKDLEAVTMPRELELMAQEDS